MIAVDMCHMRLHWSYLKTTEFKRPNWFIWQFRSGVNGKNNFVVHWKKIIENGAEKEHVHMWNTVEEQHRIIIKFSSPLAHCLNCVDLYRFVYHFLLTIFEIKQHVWCLFSVKKSDSFYNSLVSQSINIPMTVLMATVIEF